MKETCAGGEVATQGGCQNQAKAWVQARETLAGGHGQMGTTGQHREEGGKLGQVAHAGGGPLLQLCSHRTQAAPAPEGLHFCSVPPKEGVFHILSFTLVV